MKYELKNTLLSNTYSRGKQRSAALLFSSISCLTQLTTLEIDGWKAQDVKIENFVGLSNLRNLTSLTCNESGFDASMNMYLHFQNL